MGVDDGRVVGVDVVDIVVDVVVVGGGGVTVR